MDAIIYRVSKASPAGLFDIAGQPLLVRQLQWLRAMGVERIALEVPSGDDGVRMSDILEEHRALAHGLVEVVSARPLGPREIAQRAGWQKRALTVILGEDVLGTGDLVDVIAREQTSVWVRLSAPPGWPETEPAKLRIERDEEAPRKEVAGPGWGLRIQRAKDALSLTARALEGAHDEAEAGTVQSIQVHATETEPGVWLGRGVFVEEGAKLIAPVLLDSGSVVRAGAVVGPRAVVGPGAVIERGARITDSMVAPQTVVGEHLFVEHAVAKESELFDLATGETLVELDPLMLAPLTRRRAGSWMGRLTSLVGLALIPFVAVFAALVAPGRRWLRTALQRLWAGLCGDAALIGIGWNELPQDAPTAFRVAAAKAPRGLLWDVEPELYERSAGTDERLRALAWYAVAKNAKVDFGLVVSRFANRRHAAEARALS